MYISRKVFPNVTPTDLSDGSIQFEQIEIYMIP